MFQTGITQ